MLASLLGCATVRPKPAPTPARAAPGRGLALLPPRAAGFSKTMTQRVSLVRGSARFDAMGVVEISSETLTLAGLGPLGNRMMALSWDGATLTQELDPSLPRRLPAADIMRNVELVYWPEEALRQALRPGWELKSQPGRRGLLERGKEVVVVRYQGDHFKDPIEIEDIGAGYTTIIKTLESGDE